MTGKGIVRGMKRLVPMCIFVVPFGIAFGVAAVEQTLGPFQATMMSALVFTATTQFAALEFLRDPVSLASLALVALALSARHIIMGAALSKPINQLPCKQRLAAILFLSDANFADTQTLLQKGETDIGPLLGGGIMLWATWVSSTALGAYSGDMLSNTDALGFGVVMLCFFAATAFGMVRQQKSMALPAAISMAVSVGSYPFLPTGWNIILAAIVGGVIAALIHAE